MMEGREIDPSGSRFGKVMDSGGHSNEPLGCIKCRKFLKQLGAYQFQKEGNAAWSDGEGCEGSKNVYGLKQYTSTSEQSKFVV